MVGRDLRRPGRHHGDRPAARADHHQGRSPVVRRHARRAVAWNGVVLYLTTSGLLRHDPDPGRHVIGIANDFLPTGRLGVRRARRRVRSAQLLTARARRAGGLGAKPRSPCSCSAAGSAARSAVWYANTNRGMPEVGGDPRPSSSSGRSSQSRPVRASRLRGRRQPRGRPARGINVDRVRIAVFMIAGFMAGVGGIMLASRLRSVDTDGRR